MHYNSMNKYGIDDKICFYPIFAPKNIYSLCLTFYNYNSVIMYSFSLLKHIPFSISHM